MKICDEWARRGWLAVRYNLPYRQRRPKGPPSGSAAKDQAGVVEAIELAHTLTKGPVIAGGHSYGGRIDVDGDRRRRSDCRCADALLVPAASAGQARTGAHRSPCGTSPLPTVFTHGTADPFGTIDELGPAAALIPAPTEIVEITGARHDLGSKTLDVPALAVDAALRLRA